MFGLCDFDGDELLVHLGEVGRGPGKEVEFKQWPGRFASSSWWMMAEMREGTSVVRSV